MTRSKGKRPLDSTPLTGVIGPSLLPPLPAVKRPNIGRSHRLTSEVPAIDSAISEGRCFCHEVPDLLRKLADRMEESKEMRVLRSEESAQPWEKSPCPARLGSAAKGECLTSEVPAIDSAISEGRCFCHEVPDFLRKLADQMEESKEKKMRVLLSEESAHPWEKSPCPARLGSAAKGKWSHPKVTEAADDSHLELRILNPLSLPIFTHDEVTGKDGEEISVALVDANGIVKSFPEVKLNVVVLHGDFNSGNDRTWSKEDFDGHIVKKRDNKALLAGHRQVTLKGGCAKLVGLNFTDNSSFVRTKEFRLGVQVAPSDCEGLRIREAITDPFRVRDCRVKRNGKHDVPKVNDEIWRLRSIGKDGDHRRNLNDKGVETVEDFLRLLVINEQELRRLLKVGNGGMKNKQWKDLINHAKTCISSGKLYSVRTNIADIGVIVLNSFYELSELIVGSRHCSADSLTDDQKARARALVKEAYEKKMIMEYDDNHASLAQYNNRNGFQTEGLPGERLPACEGFVTTIVQPTKLQVQNFANNGTYDVPFEDLPGERLPACEGFVTTIVQPTKLQVQNFANNGTYDVPFEDLPGERLPACEGFVTTIVQPTKLQVQNFANNGTYDVPFEDLPSECLHACEGFVQPTKPQVQIFVEADSTYDYIWDIQDVRCKLKVVFNLLTSVVKFAKRRESRLGVSSNTFGNGSPSLVPM